MLTETADKRAIKQYLAKAGYFTFHNLDAIGSYAGLPGITVIKNGVVTLVMVKSPGEALTEAERVFKETWERNGGQYVCGDINTVMEHLK